MQASTCSSRSCSSASCAELADRVDHAVRVRHRRADQQDRVRRDGAAHRVDVGLEGRRVDRHQHRLARRGSAPPSGTRRAPWPAGRSPARVICGRMRARVVARRLDRQDDALGAAAGEVADHARSSPLRCAAAIATSSFSRRSMLGNDGRVERVLGEVHRVRLLDDLLGLACRGRRRRPRCGRRARACRRRETPPGGGRSRPSTRPLSGMRIGEECHGRIRARQAGCLTRQTERQGTRQKRKRQRQKVGRGSLPFVFCPVCLVSSVRRA